ncbi:MAG: type II toxin-antitoxin system VapB family antitoxin [Terrimicrobiaceae bacterium]
MARVPYRQKMKMTMHIDEELLANVMEATGATTKTEAVDMALREVSRRVRLRKLMATPIKNMDEMAPEAVFDFKTYDRLRAAESPARYGTRRPG